MLRRSLGDSGQVRRFLVLLSVLLGVASARPCEASDWLVLLVDRSHSIDDAELAMQRDAYIRLLSDPAVVQALGDTLVAIVEFDSRPELIVDWAEPATAARLYQSKPPDGVRGQTAIGHAIASALALLAGKGGRQIIDISGDGKENVDPGLLARARAAATERAIEINGLAIRTKDTPDLDAYYGRQVVNGFVLSVDQPEDFFGALKRKLFFEIAGLTPWPPPAARAAAEGRR
jgi:hypothetical protein